MGTTTKTRTTTELKSAVVGKSVIEETPKPAAKPTVRSFKDLGTWKLAHELAVATYRQCELLPASAQVLVGQLTGTVTGVCSYIAESFSLRGTEKDRAFTAAQGLLGRLESQLLIAEAVGYLGKGETEDLTKRCSHTHWALLKLQKINREWTKGYTA